MFHYTVSGPTGGGERLWAYKIVAIYIDCVVKMKILEYGLSILALSPTSDMGEEEIYFLSGPLIYSLIM